MDEHDDLVRDQRSAVRGEVRFSAGDRAIYSTDSSSYRQLPIGVVIPRTVEDVVAAVEVCRHHDVPVLVRPDASRPGTGLDLKRANARRFGR